MTAPTAFPELAAEQDRLAFARACRDAMIRRFEDVDPTAAADEITAEYVEATVAEALDDLRSPGAGDFFGRIDDQDGERTYLGRRHIEDDEHDPVVVDWRAPIAAAYYRATVADPFGLAQRRRFTLRDGELTAYLDEHLDDPDAADVATGIPDPVLAEIGAARTGAMREIVATIQAEQDHVIRSPMEGCTIVQGGPGTGKTAVALHRAAFLLFQHRRRLAREGVLVVGPNRVFLDYVRDVLPSLGERSVQQRTVAEICFPRVEVAGADDAGDAALLGDERMLTVLARAVRAGITVPSEPIRVPLGARTLVVEPDEVAAWIAAALDGRERVPLNRRRDGLRALVRQEVERRTGRDDAWSQVAPLRAALDAAWPSQQPVPVLRRLLGDPATLAASSAGLLDAEEVTRLTRAGRPGTKRRPWTPALALLADELSSLLAGPPATFAHVVVDEAQDHSAVALRVIGRRAPTGSLTLVGDLAQSTTPAGQRDWHDVGRHVGVAEGEARLTELTIGYRVPAPILEVANRLLPLTGVRAEPSRSVRVEGDPPAVRLVERHVLGAAAVDELLAVRRRHHLTGFVAPLHRHEELAASLAATGHRAVGHLQDLDEADVPLLAPEGAKGLELDGVVVVNPHEILDGTERGARLLYVALTRAVQVLHLVTDAPLPAPLAPA